jgi:hypothetical protein
MTAYGLAKPSNGVISLPTAYRLASGDFKTISATVIETLCDVLHVEPGDLFRSGKKPARLPAAGPRRSGDREFTGVWWRPDDPDEQLTGTLVIDKEHRGELRLIGAFRDLNALQQPFTHSVILGVGGGQKITLINSLESGYVLSAPGVSTSRYTPDIVYLGAHVPDQDDAKFDQVYASYHNLREWSRLSGLRETLHPDPEGGVTGFTLSYIRPPATEGWRRRVGSRTDVHPCTTTKTCQPSCFVPIIG